MGFTRIQFRTALDNKFGDSGNLLWTAAQKNDVINEAIDALWPEVKSSKKDVTQVLAADTYLYTPTGQPTDMGYSQAFLEQDTDEEYLLLRRVMQYRELVSGSLKWIIDIPKDIVDNNDAGKTILLRYHGPFDHYSVALYAGSTIAFVAATHKITDTANGLAVFNTGDIILVQGSTLNDGTYTVATGGVAGEIVVTEDLVEEALGDAVVITDGNVQDVPWLPVLYYSCYALCVIMLQKAGSSDISTWRDQIAVWKRDWKEQKKENLVLAMKRYIGLRRR